MWFKKKNKIPYVSPTGIDMTGELKYKRGKEWLELLGRGLAVFLIAFGTIGCFASSMDAEYNLPLIVVILLIICVYLCFLFYNNWFKNVGYIVMFATFVGLMVPFFMAINSGFYALYNTFLGKVEIAFDLPGVMEYTERIDNRYYTITVCLAFLGFGLCVILNMLISNYMSIIRTVLITLPIATIGCYIGYNPSGIYVIMLFVGYILVYSMKRSNHYKSGKSGEHFKVIDKGNCKKYLYHSNGKIMFQLSGLLFGIICMYILFMTILIPNKYVNVPDSWRSFRKPVDNFVSEFAMSGLAGVFNWYGQSDGITGGDLTNLGSVYPDHQRDLVIEYTPYSNDALYLRGFIGIDYNHSVWTSSSNYNDETIDKAEARRSANKESTALQDNYESGKGMKGRMMIRNVGGAEEYPYLPYYTNIDGLDNVTNREDDIVVGASRFEEDYYVEYYPYVEGVKQAQSYEVSDRYLDIPEENRQVIDDFCKEAGFSGNKDTIDEELTQYFIDNYPYTMRPGRTPEGEDFVNYFLTTNKKGLCAHFASAATLVFRHYGIPARYVEGYAVSYLTVTDSEIIEGADYDDWFDGDNELGETAVVSVDIDDSMAHGWVEIYDDEFGWIPVDVTPPSGEDDASDEGFWDRITDAMSNANADNGAGFGGNAIGKVVIVVIMLAVAVLLYFLWKIFKLLMRKIRQRNSFSKGEYNDRINNYYKYICNIYRAAFEDYRVEMTHMNQIRWIASRSGVPVDEGKIDDILHRAGYSNEKISEEEYIIVEKYIKTTYNILIRNIKKKKRIEIWIKN